MSLRNLSALHLFQLRFVRTAKTAATPASTKKKESVPTPEEEHFPDDEAANEGNTENDGTGTVGRERSLNRVQLIGRVGADPKVGGTERHKVVTFNLATNEYAGVNTNSGEIKQRVDWHRIAIFQPRLLDNAEKYVRQGDRLYVQGRLHHNRLRDKQTGEDRYVTSIIGDDLIFLNKK